MTVKELIERLKFCSPDAKVNIRDWSRNLDKGGPAECGIVEVEDYSGVVILDSE